MDEETEAEFVHRLKNEDGTLSDCRQFRLILAEDFDRLVDIASRVPGLSN